MAPLAALTLLDQDSPLEVPAVVDGDGVRLAPDVVQRSLGWHLEAAGLCRGDTCVPVRPEHGVLRDDGLDLRTLASLLDRPLALDVDERIACLGASAAERGDRLRSLDAPEFTLPDVAGRPHSLSEHRGRKVLLLAWASW
jgi:hypothetical protein